MSKVSLKLSKTCIDAKNIEEEEQIEMKYHNKLNQSVQLSKFNTQVDMSQSFLLENEIIINVVVKDYNENIILKKIVLQIDERDKANNIIEESIIQFNRLFEYERICVKFSSDDLSLFNLKPSKKNGLPNYDMPGILKIFSNPFFSCQL
jgi:hypothetical protein